MAVKPRAYRDPPKNVYQGMMLVDTSGDMVEDATVNGFEKQTLEHS